MKKCHQPNREFRVVFLLVSLKIFKKQISIFQILVVDGMIDPGTHLEKTIF